MFQADHYGNNGAGSRVKDQTAEKQAQEEAARLHRQRLLGIRMYLRSRKLRAEGKA